MEATRPDPVDINQFAVGENRMAVIQSIGSPVGNVKNGGDNCDVYKLYTKGPGDIGKGAIAATEVVADVFTLGLAEIITTPVEAATRNSQHTVTFCYDADNKIASINDGGAGAQ
jgi:hypothetical protein